MQAPVEERATIAAIESERTVARAHLDRDDLRASLERRLNGAARDDNAATRG